MIIKTKVGYKLEKKNYQFTKLLYCQCQKNLKTFNKDSVPTFSLKNKSVSVKTKIITKNNSYVCRIFVNFLSLIQVNFKVAPQKKESSLA